jgi:hypothetical protein
MDLPEGWTFERIREVAQVSEVALIPPETVVFLETRDGDKSDYEQVTASVILQLGGLCLVLPDDEEDDWLMGQAADDGTIACWAYYGPLEEALQAL